VEDGVAEIYATLAELHLELDKLAAFKVEKIDWQDAIKGAIEKIRKLAKAAGATSFTVASSVGWPPSIQISLTFAV